MDAAVFIKVDEEPDPRYGSPPQNRSIQEHIRRGIVNIDKPAGPTSHEVSAWVKKMMGFKKTGHSGTLDPKVTGVLPIALEGGTHVLQALLLSSKEYVIVMKLHAEATNSQIKKALSLFQGELYQKPPLKSAVKRQLRKRFVYSNRFLEREGDFVLFTCECEAGTYMRKLCHDIGLYLGVGAHMQALRRSKAGPFDESTLITLHDLRDALEVYREKQDEKPLRDAVKPMENAAAHLPKIWVRDSAVSSVCHGSALNLPGVAKLTKDIRKNDLIALFTLRGELIALAKSRMDAQDIMSESKGVAAAPERVMIRPNAYPRIWKSGSI